jgi:hypothetical protein
LSHAWLVQGALVGILWGLLPYLLLVVAWDFIATWMLLMPVLLTLIATNIDAGLAFKESTSSTAAVGLGMWAIFASLVVGVAAGIAAILPSKRNRAHRDRC